MKEIYNKIYSKQSNAWRLRRMPFYKKLASFIYSEDNVIDIGCGNGLLPLISKWKTYLGIDYSNVAIEQAKKICPKAIFVCDDVFSYIKKNVYYNVAVLTEFLEHIENDIDIINEIKKGAKIIISVPNNETTINGKPTGCRLHLRSYTIETLAQRYNIIEFKEIFVFLNWIIAVGIKK